MEKLKIDDDDSVVSQIWKYEIGWWTDEAEDDCLFLIVGYHLLEDQLNPVKM
jgi:hypothetical protein